jgi:hypothetical protein
MVTSLKSFNWVFMKRKIILFYRIRVKFLCRLYIVLAMANICDFSSAIAKNCKYASENNFYGFAKGRINIYFYIMQLPLAKQLQCIRGFLILSSKACVHNMHLCTHHIWYGIYFNHSSSVDDRRNSFVSLI